MGKSQQYPKPKLRLKGGAWRIRWSANYKDYEFAAGLGEGEAESAETMRAEVELALRTGKWPEWAESVETIRKWRGVTEDEKCSEETPDSSAALSAWKKYYASFSTNTQVASRFDHLATLAARHSLLTLTSQQAAGFVSSLSECAPIRNLSGKIAALMGGQSMSRKDIIAALEKSGEKFTDTTLSSALWNRKVFSYSHPKGHLQSGVYKAIIPGKGLSPATRNKYLESFNMFYSWAMKEGLITKNPFDGIGRAKLSDHAEIVWLTRDERYLVTAAADPLPCRLSVWIALYAGLRLGEIARLRWEDIDLRGRWIHVKKSKTGKTRRVPISESLLCAIHRGEKPTGFVCPHWQDGDYHVRADSDILPLAKALPGLAKKLKWNIFRHTFASLLAQTGKVSIDQISALMGNTPEVCRRHYAHLIPDAVERTGIDLID